jgi:E3 SUMO-protein ligase RanBP2
MSAPPLKPSQPTATTFNERLNEQLINCLNVQTNVIQNLAQYSQHISLQLFEIKNIVEILSNRVLALQQQQQQSHFASNHYAASYYPTYMPQPPIPVSHPPPPSHFPPAPHSVPQPPVQVRLPTTTTTAPTSNFPFFSPNIAHSQPPPPPPPTTVTSLLPNLASFQFSTSTNAPPPPSQTTITNTLPPTTTTPTKSIFSNVPKFGTTDITNKPPASTISFSTSTTNSNNEKPSNIIAPFTFGTGNMTSIFGTGSLTSGLPTPSIITKQENHADENGDDEGEGDSYEPDNSSFKPIVQLSAVEVKTGEEDENVLFCERGKLYRFDSATNQMKERGIGEIKILQHKTTKLCRILMRREQVLKLCANHQITSQMELKPHQGSTNAFIWSAMDFADGEAKHETLCIRFKTDEQAKNFAKVFNEAKMTNSKKSGDLPAIGKISLNDDTKSKSTANDDDVITIGETKPSAEQIDRAKKLQLPSTFYLYENKEPCKGCPGCEDESPPTTSNENKTATKKQTDTTTNDTKTSAPQTPSTGSGPKTPLSSSENMKFSFTNSEKSQPQMQKQTSKEEKSSTESPSPAPSATSQYDNKPSIFGNFNGGSGTSIFGSTTPIGNSNGSIFGGSAAIKPANNNNGGFSFPGFGNTTGVTTPSTGFQFSTPTATSTAATTNTNTSSTFSFGGAGNQPLFGNAPKFSFSDIAKQTSNNDKPISNGTEQRVFAGQGSLIFGTTPVNTTTTTGNHHEDDDGEGGGGVGGDDESYEPNVSFKPIVQLSAVEVKTGEEDENVLFCERGKLYRFDPEANQMKERGIGEMKILQHKTTNLCRILMRREQVLKLCANHQITSQMELKPHQGSENAYVWSAMDFAEGEAKHETLCIRFKSSDIAKRFLKQFNDAKQANANAQQ